MHNERQPTTIALTNQKGGVGKTTTAINLGTALAQRGYQVLLVDLDPQGNASTGLGCLKADRTVTTYDLLQGDVDLKGSAFQTSVENLSLIPGTTDLSSADMDLITQPDRLQKVQRALSVPSRHAFDFILIDCPPALNLLTINALVAADGVVVPLQCEFFALEGLSQLMMTVQQIRKSLNSTLRTLGIVLTMYDKRNNLSGQVEADVRENLERLVFRTIIPRNVRLSEAPSHFLPGLVYDPNCSGSIAYRALAEEFLLRLEKQHA